MDIRQELLNIQNNYKKTSWTVVLKGKKDLVSLLQNLYGNLPLKELFYLGINGNIDIICENGNEKLFNTIETGYTKFCTTSNNCKCFQELLSKASKIGWETKGYIDRKIKKEQTCLKKYGVKNVFQSERIKEKAKQTILEHWGVTNPAKNVEIQQKIECTNIERYGVKSFTQTDEYVRKTKDTNLERYGVEWNLSDPELIKQRKQTSLERYGVDNPSKSIEIKNKIKQSYYNKTGRYNFSQMHWSDDTFEIMQDKTKFEHICRETPSYLDVIKKLKIDIQTFKRYYDNYNLSVYTFNTASKYEDDFATFLTSYNINFEQHVRNVIYPKELDFYLPEYKLGIELDGLFWHSEFAGKKDKWYHYNKTIECERKQIQLLHIWQNEWEHKPNIWKNRILALTHNITERIGARKTSIIPIKKDVADKFLNMYHLQGTTPRISYSLGAYYDNKLIGVMTFCKQNDTTELTRFCVSNIIVPGLFSKMLTYYYTPGMKLFTFADKRYSNGDLYIKNGFKIESIQQPMYYYTDYKSVWHKFNFRKQRIKQVYGLDISNKTETELIIELKLDRIWDAGKIKFSYHP